MNCPLCNHGAKFEQSVNSAEIISIWKKWGINVSRLFHTKTISLFNCGECGLGFYNPPNPGDDEFYGELASWDWYYKHSGKSEYQFSSALIAQGNMVLDVGCGIGEFASYLPEGAVFFGAELSSKSVKIANSLGRNVRQTDITTPPNDFLNKFDVVTGFQVLEHIVDIREFFASIIALCKPGGKIVIAVPNNAGFVGDAVNNILNMPPHHALLWNKSSLYYLGNEFNLKVISYVEESLSEIHRKWGYTVLVNKSFRRFFGLKHKVVDLSFLGKIIYKVSSIISLPLAFIAPDIISSGHSSIIVFEKPKSE